MSRLARSMTGGSLAGKGGGWRRLYGPGAAWRWRGAGAVVSRAAMPLEVRQGAAGGADLGGQHLQYLERQQRVASHQAGEVLAGDVVEPGAVVGDGGERVGLVADQSRQTKKRTGGRLDGHQLLPGGRCHGEGGLALAENVQALRAISLVEQNAISATEDCGGTFFERLDQLRVGNKRRRV